MSRRLRSWFPFAVAAVGALAWVTAEAAPIAAKPPKPTKLTLPTRPLVGDPQTFDYAALPLTARRGAHAACRDTVVSYVRKGGSPRPYATAMPVPLELVGLPKDASLRVGNTFCMDHVMYDPFPPTATRAEWVQIERARTTPTTASLSRCEGNAIREQRLGADTWESVDAAAIVPNRIYAYRRCVEGCNRPLGDAKRSEELDVVTSPAVYISSTGWASNPRGYGERNPTSFSRAFATVRPGTSATFVVLLPSETEAHGPLESSPPSLDVDSFDLDVSWLEENAPVLTLFPGHAKGDARAFKP